MTYWVEQQKQNVRFFWGRFRRAHIRITPYATWFGDEEGAALISARTGRTLGYFSHDGYGKYEIILCVSYWRAVRLIWAGHASLIGPAGLVWCSLSVFRAKSPESAAHVIEELTGAVLWQPWLDGN
jgi:hypothetical protein